MFVMLSKVEKVVFDIIKIDLTRFTFIVYFNPKRRLFVDFNVFTSGIRV